MATLKVGKSLNDSDSLWRYLSLDKFINLVHSNELFFAPLAWYEETDPFEGYAPLAMMNSIAKRFAEPRDKIATRLDEFEEKIKSTQTELSIELKNEIESIRGDIKNLMPSIKDYIKNIISRLAVNCWYSSEHESEGMWNLYSKQGIAIKTSVKSIKASLNGNTQDYVIDMGRVKYLDFNAEGLTENECTTEDGQSIGMIKRVAYKHENEVRLLILPGPLKLDNLIKPEPVSVSVNLSEMIEAIVISPIAGRALEDAVRAVCHWSGIEDRKVSKSKMLENCEYLLNGYN